MSYVLGLTGSIGMGKSTVAAMFRKAGVPVFDADAEVRRLQGPGGALLAAIERLHPGTTGDAGINRDLLGRQLFGDRAALARLERLIHPAVRRAERDFVRRHRAHRLVVLDIPLLFERGGYRRVDGVAVVSAPAWKQRRRVLVRPGMSWAKLKRILPLQLADAAKRRRADLVIPTGGTIERTRAATRRVAACLRARAKG
jgi:dephospho-CoA kinase